VHNGGNDTVSAFCEQVDGSLDALAALANRHLAPKASPRNNDASFWRRGN